MSACVGQNGSGSLPVWPIIFRAASASLLIDPKNQVFIIFFLSFLFKICSTQFLVWNATFSQACWSNVAKSLVSFPIYAV